MRELEHALRGLEKMHQAVAKVSFPFNIRSLKIFVNLVETATAENAREKTSTRATVQR